MIRSLSCFLVGVVQALAVSACTGDFDRGVVYELEQGVIIYATEGAAGVVRIPSDKEDKPAFPLSDRILVWEFDETTTDLPLETDLSKWRVGPSESFGAECRCPLRGLTDYLHAESGQACPMPPGANAKLWIRDGEGWRLEAEGRARDLDETLSKVSVFEEGVACASPRFVTPEQIEAEGRIPHPMEFEPWDEIPEARFTAVGAFEDQMVALSTATVVRLQDGVVQALSWAEPQTGAYSLVSVRERRAENSRLGYFLEGQPYLIESCERICDINPDDERLLSAGRDKAMIGYDENARVYGSLIRSPVVHVLETVDGREAQSLLPAPSDAIFEGGAPSEEWQLLHSVWYGLAPAIWVAAPDAIHGWFGRITSYDGASLAGPPRSNGGLASMPGVIRSLWVDAPDRVVVLIQGDDGRVALRELVQDPSDPSCADFCYRPVPGVPAQIQCGSGDALQLLGPLPRLRIIYDDGHVWDWGSGCVAGPGPARIASGATTGQGSMFLLGEDGRLWWHL